MECEKCKQEIIPEEWRKAGWGPGPHYGVGICGCAEGLPVLEEGDIIVDRNYQAGEAKITTYGYVAKNIMCIQRPDKEWQEKYDQSRWVVIWQRKEAEAGETR